MGRGAAQGGNMRGKGRGQARVDRGGETGGEHRGGTGGGQQRAVRGPDGSRELPQVEREEGNGRNERSRRNRIDVTRELVLASPSGSGCPVGHHTNPEGPSSQGRGGVTMIARETRQTRKRGVDSRQDQE